MAAVQNLKSQGAEIYAATQSKNPSYLELEIYTENRNRIYSLKEIEGLKDELAEYTGAGFCQVQKPNQLQLQPRATPATTTALPVSAYTPPPLSKPSPAPTPAPTPAPIPAPTSALPSPSFTAPSLSTGGGSQCSAADYLFVLG